MTMKPLCVLAALIATPVLANDLQGDAANGAAQFARQCVSCHVIKNDDGETLVGRNAKAGPNLFAIAGAQLGAVPGYRYGKSIVEAGELGAIWTEANFVGYVQDPTNWLRDKLSSKRARGKMSFRVRKDTDAYDIYAYLATFTDADTLQQALDGAAAAEINN